MMSRKDLSLGRSIDRPDSTPSLKVAIDRINAKPRSELRSRSTRPTEAPTPETEIIGPALRLLRVTTGLSQTAAGKLDGAPDHRTISHWETRFKLPSLRLLTGYLAALGFDYHDFQDALDQVAGIGLTVGRVEKLSGQVGRLARMCEGLAELIDLERRSGAVLSQRVELATERLTARLNALDPTLDSDDPGIVASLGRLANWAESFGAEIERRVAALERGAS